MTKREIVIEMVTFTVILAGVFIAQAIDKDGFLLFFFGYLTAQAVLIIRWKARRI